MTCIVRVYSGWARRAKYSELNDWIGDSSNTAEWDPNSGFTIVDGEKFQSVILLESEEDMLVCLLKFSEIAVRGTYNI